MPTENRSSSNHGTRTFTLDTLTAALEQVQALHEISADLIAENVFGQPAQQAQRNPIPLPEGYMLAERSIWTEQQVEAATACITRLKGVPGMRDRDLAMAAIDAAQCKAPEVTLADLLPAQQGQGEPIMLELQEDGDGGLEVQWLLEGGTSELFHGMTLLVAENAPDLCSEDGSAQVYTHADPAEALNNLEDAKEACSEIERTGTPGDVIREMNDELVDLRAQLAERNALLLQASGLLKVSAERLPRKHQTIREHINHLHGRIECDLSASAEPSAPVEIDERAEFEKAVIDKAERFQPELRQYGDNADAEYRDANIEWGWGLWQARAALERKP